jgi:hypothetical protein
MSEEAGLFRVVNGYDVKSIPNHKSEKQTRSSRDVRLASSCGFGPTTGHGGLNGGEGSERALLTFLFMRPRLYTDDQRLDRRRSEARTRAKLHRVHAAQDGHCMDNACYEPVRPGRTVCARHALVRKIGPLHLAPVERERALLAFAAFDGRCQCCGSTDPGKVDWCLDHDHKTKKFRGIICVFCNTMLGMARDSSQTLRAGAAYLDDRRNR